MTDNTHMNDTIVYVDESGDHQLERINPYYPSFTLAFCVFNISDYIQNISLALDTFKVKYFGHSDIVLHENDIRKNRHGEWAILNAAQTREHFHQDLAEVIEEAPFDIIATTVDKMALTDVYREKAQDPYALSLLFCMERLHEHLLELQQRSIRIHCESRTRKLDTQLRKAFHDIRHKTFFPSTHTNFEGVDYRFAFLDKQSNCNGLQIADLIVRPIGLSYLRPEQENRTYSLIKNKILEHKIFQPKKDEAQ